MSTSYVTSVEDPCPLQAGITRVSQTVTTTAVGSASHSRQPTSKCLSSKRASPANKAIHYTTTQSARRVDLDCLAQSMAAPSTVTFANVQFRTSSLAITHATRPATMMSARTAAVYRFNSRTQLLQHKEAF